jgi:diamine N-acetyltransferase
MHPAGPAFVDSPGARPRGRPNARCGRARVFRVVDVRLLPVGAENWRDCAALRVTDEQRRWVADVTYYLSLCAYGRSWHPLAIEADEQVAGFVIWGVDDDASRWIGGLVIDAGHQRRGIAKQALVALIRVLIAQEGCTEVALSYGPDNVVARSLYAALGFVETGETADDGAELVARMSLETAHDLTDGSAPGR